MILFRLVAYGRFPNDQFGTQDDGIGGMNAGSAIQVIDEVTGGDLSHFITRVIDRSKVGFDHGGNRVIVETGKGDVLWNSNTALFQRHHASCRTVVIGYKD